MNCSYFTDSEARHSYKLALVKKKNVTYMIIFSLPGEEGGRNEPEVKRQRLE